MAKVALLVILSCVSFDTSWARRALVENVQFVIQGPRAELVSESKGKIVSITGPSGAGKDTLMGAILEDADFEQKAVIMPQIMTRQQRSTNDTTRITFKTPEMVESMKKDGELALCNGFASSKYAITMADANEVIAKGQLALTDLAITAIDAEKQYLNPKFDLSNVLTVVVLPGGSADHVDVSRSDIQKEWPGLQREAMKTFRSRLEARGDMNKEQIEERWNANKVRLDALAAMVQEPSSNLMRHQENTLFLVNDVLKESIAQLKVWLSERS